jgi:hypothetical protein
VKKNLSSCQDPALSYHPNNIQHTRHDERLPGRLRMSHWRYGHKSLSRDGVTGRGEIIPTHLIPFTLASGSLSLDGGQDTKVCWETEHPMSFVLSFSQQSREDMLTASSLKVSILNLLVLSSQAQQIIPFQNWVMMEQDIPCKLGGWEANQSHWPLTSHGDLCGP